ncbi:hypothetical protein H5410_023259 [Solanum commersonii]|uniref:DUF7746 domain-containing protein n=1 Tax=Solanum commersonii TaxID=4109 RepID=A0A9J5ZH21_SOLCO|nr:hypothetical protein H5410_023259 [Solanum commersonii]
MERKSMNGTLMVILIDRFIQLSIICLCTVLSVKPKKNSDKTIANMLTVGFTGQLKGWWDNYLNQEQRDKVLQAVKLEGEQYTQNAVYTLVLNIIEHFSGRWSDNRETIRTLLQGLERPSGEKITEGLALCNEIKLNQQIKRHRLNERKQLGKFCEQFAFDIPKKNLKKRIILLRRKNLPKKIMKNGRKRGLKRSLEGLKKEKEILLREGKSIARIIIDPILATNVEDLIILNSDSDKSGSESSSDEGSSTSEDLKALQQEDYITSEDECSPCQQGMACEKEDDEDDLYKIYAQFKELSLNVIDNNKIIDKTSNNPPSKDKDHITEEIPTKEGSYTMAEVKNLLLERRKMISSLTTINDLKEEVNILKEDILRLKEKNVVIEVRLDAIQTRQDLENVSSSSSSSSLEGENNSLNFMKNLYLKNDKKDFLYSLKDFTSQKIIIKLWEKIAILENQFSLDICGDHPNAFWNKKKHVVNLPYEDGFDENNIPTKARPCQMNSEYLELYKKEISSLLQKDGMAPPSRRGRGGRTNAGRGGHILAQQDNKTLTTFNSNVSAASSSGTSGIDIDHPMYKEFINFMKSKKEPDNNPTYSSILIDKENTEVFDMNDKKEVILLLEENDHKWRNEPWQIMARYLDTVSYTTVVYKYKMHYEIILSSTGCEFQHFYPTNTKKVYNFFKLIIKKILAPEEWGMSTLKELDYIHPEQKIAVKYNYWDYIDGFNKVLLYENANKKHSWFIKICSNVFDRHIPN